MLYFVNAYDYKIIKLIITLTHLFQSSSIQRTRQNETGDLDSFFFTYSRLINLRKCTRISRLTLTLCRIPVS